MFTVAELDESVTPVLGDKALLVLYPHISDARNASAKEFRRQHSDGILVRYLHGESTSKIAKSLDAYPTNIINALKDRGVRIRGALPTGEHMLDRKRKGREARAQHGDTIERLYLEGKTSNDIESMTGVGESLCITILRERGVDVRGGWKRTYHFNEHAFDHIDNEHAAYFLGFLYADGSINASMSAYQNIDDRDVLDKLRTFLGSDAEVRPVKKSVGAKNKKQLMYFSASSKHMVERLKKHGCTPGKSYTATFPDISKEMRRHFIRGLWDGDGTISIRRGKTTQAYIGLCGTVWLCEGVADILKEVAGDDDCVRMYEADRHHTSFRSMAIGRGDAFRKILDWMYEDATVFLDRKMGLYKELKANHKAWRSR
jgi:hypothetical protein